MTHSPLRFLGEFVREPLTVGAVWPSSRALSRVVADSCHVRHDSTLVELGAGTGAFTELLLERVGRRGRFLAIEINATNAAILRRRFPNCTVVLDSAERLAACLNGARADCIVSGLAWGTMPRRTQNQILSAVLDSLTRDGHFIAFAYAHAAWLPASRRFGDLLRRHFTHVETTPIVWRNLPPAFVIRCSGKVATVSQDSSRALRQLTTSAKVG